MGFLFFLFLFVFSAPRLEAVFERAPGFIESEAKFLALHPFDDNSIYVAAEEKLYKKDLDSWRLIYQLKEGNINFIYPDPGEYGLVFLATDSGLLLTRDAENFEHIFRDRGRGARCYHVLRLGEKIFLGTSNGLYQGEMDIFDFKRIESLPEGVEVYWVTFSAPFLFVASNQGVFRSKDFRNFERTFIVTKSNEAISEADSNNDINEEASRNIPRVIVVDTNVARRIYLGTSNGVFVSDDYGANFKKRYLQGLPDVGINCILQDKIISEPIYIATEAGLFKAYPDRRVAMQVYEGLPVNRVNYVGIDAKGKLYLATGAGVFIEGEDGREYMERNYQMLCSQEPDYREIQEAALEYNEVEPEKIRAWRKSLKYRALLPQLKLGYDKTVTTALGATYDKVQVGPRDWNMDITWNLEDLIWNSYQDDIDTRSRLNTQLRLDILDEVNRLYFERRRVKLELSDVVPKNTSEYIKKMMYLEELTAALDAYTGGYFSKRLEELQSQTP